MEKIAHAQFSAEYNRLEPIRKYLEEYAVKVGLPPDVVYDLILAATEIVTNVIKHGYKGEPGSIEVILGRGGSDFIVKIRDDAPIYNPETTPEPDLSLPLNKMPLGGLGVYMTKNLVDSLSHRTTENSGNEVTLVKKDIIKV